MADDPGIWLGMAPSGSFATGIGAFDPIDPSSILPAVELHLAGRSMFIDRPVIEVVATPSPIDDNDEESSDWRFATHGLGGGADEYELLVDAEQGILLRSEARVGDEPFRIIEMEGIAFDEELGDAPSLHPPIATSKLQPLLGP